MKYVRNWVAFGLSLAAFPALSAEVDDMDVTMSVIESQEAATEQEFVQEIKLPVPEAAARNARGQEIASEAAADARDTARNEARDNARDNARGNETAEQARQQGEGGERGRSGETRQDMDTGQGGQAPVDLPDVGGGRP